MTDTLTVEIPADVRDNSETVTDYAFMRHRAYGTMLYHTVDRRDQEIKRVTMFPQLDLTHYTWHDVNPDGQRCHFDMVVDRHGTVVNLFHTEYWTRVPCQNGYWCHAYASHYILVTNNGEPTTVDPLPFCDEHTDTVVEVSALFSYVDVHRSERLLIGQHD